MTKALILFLYGTTLYITLSRWYNAGNSGMPEPKTIAPASYLFGILALTADFLEGFPVVIALGLTYILYVENANQTTQPRKTAGEPMNLGQNQTPRVQQNLQKAANQGGVVLRKSGTYIPPVNS